MISSTLGTHVTIIDEKRSLPEGWDDVHFISRHRSRSTQPSVERPSNVIKDYILSPEAYVLE